jgi:hypothetical protein
MTADTENTALPAMPHPHELVLLRGQPGLAADWRQLAGRLLPGCTPSRLTGRRRLGRQPPGAEGPRRAGPGRDRVPGWAPAGAGY